MDALSRTLVAARSGPPNAVLTEVSAPFGLRFRPIAGMGFHIVLQGGCVLLSDSAEPQALTAGDVVVLRAGQGHALAHDPHAALTDFVPEASSGATGRICLSDSPDRTRILCGAYRLEQLRPDPLLLQFPDVITLRAAYGTDRPIGLASELLLAEAERTRPGTDLAATGLITYLLVLALRTWLSRASTGDGRPGPLDDAAVVAVLDAIHTDPARRWTLPALATLADLSASTLSRRFTEALGEPPSAYLTSWRMTLAAQLLRDTDLTLAAIATRTGYATEFALSKSFRRHFDIAPGSYRQRHRVVDERA